MKNIFHASGNKKKSGVPILISDKIDFKTKAVTRDREGHYIMINGTIQQEDITLVNIYAPNMATPTYIKQFLTDTKGETDNNTIIVGNLTLYLHQWIHHPEKIELPHDPTIPLPGIYPKNTKTPIQKDT